MKRVIFGLLVVSSMLVLGGPVAASEDTGPGDGIHHDDAVFVVRLGALYDFHVGNWTLSPSYYVDVLELSKNHILGLGFGRGF